MTNTYGGGAGPSLAIDDSAPPLPPLLSQAVVRVPSYLCHGEGLVVLHPPHGAIDKMPKGAESAQTSETPRHTSSLNVTCMYLSGRLRSLTGVPWRLRCFSTFSTFSGIMVSKNPSHAEGAKTDPPPWHTYGGTSTTA